MLPYVSTATGVTITWNAVPNANQYSLWISTDGGTTQTPLPPVTAATYVDNALTPGSSYIYYVQAVNTTNNALSAQVSQTIYTPPYQPGNIAPTSTANSVTLGWVEPANGNPQSFELQIDRLEILYRETENLFQRSVVSKQICELRNIIYTGYLVITQAMLRKESRGLHYTIDYPKKNKI